MVRSAGLFVGENSTSVLRCLLFKLILSQSSLIVCSSVRWSNVADRGIARNVATILVSPRQRAHKTYEIMRASQAVAFDKSNAKVEVTEDVAEWEYVFLDPSTNKLNLVAMENTKA